VSEVVDGVRYLERPCVECGAIVSVAEAAIEVADRRVWPKCGPCANEPLLYLSVIGEPAPQGSKTRTRWGVREDNPRTKPWRATVAAEAAVAMHGKPMFAGPLHLSVVFYFPRPKSHYGTGRNANVLKPNAPSLHRVKPDIDKLLRAVGDSLSGIAFQDDSQIARVVAVKAYGSPPRAEVTVRSATRLLIETKTAA
jgi:crossover junction endodeoxyribonuclease RusA